jgi:hypothetical protein
MANSLCSLSASSQPQNQAPYPVEKPVAATWQTSRRNQVMRGGHRVQHGNCEAVDAFAHGVKDRDDIALVVLRGI